MVPIETLESRRLLSAALSPAAVGTNALAAADVEQILAAAGSQARPGQVAAVVDREGTLLGIYSATGGDPLNATGIATLAVARARTAAAFQSEQNAFTTRTARFIIQDHFPFPVRNTAGGPLYGVQFSSLPGGDVVLPAYQTGISGDPGGVPLYVNGVPVGGIGVAGDLRDVAPTNALLPITTATHYGAAANPRGRAFDGSEGPDFDESVALAGARGFDAPKRIRAGKIFVDGLRFPFAASGRAHANPVRSLADLVSTSAGQTIALPALGKPDATPIAGAPRIADAELAGVPGLFRIRNAAGHTDPQQSDPVIDSDDTDTTRLTADDVTQILSQAVAQSKQTRAGIRQPIGVNAVIHAAVVDRDGTVLGVFRTGDGTNFSYDVAVQKARTAAFFSDDTHALSTRAVGFLAQRYFPPGIEPGGRGPLYGLQDALSLSPNRPAGPLPNGITIFPGGVPLYKDGQRVGAIGISGDGVDPDDLIAFAGATGFQPEADIRSDHLSSSDAADFVAGRVANLTAALALDPALATRARERLDERIDDVRLPYVKFPRNPRR